MGGGIRRHPLKDHPNFELPTPEPDESQITFVLRAAAGLVSPPKIEGEHYSIKCDDVAKQLIELGDELQQRWNDVRTT